ncbi:MAG: HAD-IC family P-type ATPase [Acidimicrobiales bacterium]|nr:HAD-IC family P-type ATPase [Acidimicrobiales bacterium]
MSPRPSPELLIEDRNVGVGLTSEEAARRHAAALGNQTDHQSTRSLGSIVRGNVLTRFNAIITSLAVVVLVFGSPVDALFGFVMILNSVIGVVQEIRAKRSLDAVQVLITPNSEVFRDGTKRSIAAEDLVLGDVVALKAGDQIPIDGTVLTSQGLEADESALTGESEPVPKPEEAKILSGSFVTAGTGTVVATAVGTSSWVYQLTKEAKTFVLTQSELRVGIDRLLRVVSWIVPPIAGLLLWSQLRSQQGFDEATVSAVAGVVGLVPQGLVLLVSMALAVAVVRLAKQQVVVQELPAVEGLARVDMLCVDKTGTLTTGHLALDKLHPIGVSDGKLRAGIAAITELDGARTTTTEVIQDALGWHPSDWTVQHSVPFSSVRKWSGGTFRDHGSWVLGAPEVLLDSMAGLELDHVIQQLHDLTGQGRRVLLVAQTDAVMPDAPELPERLRPIGLVSLKEEVRPDGAAAMEYFRAQNVTVKVISGDNPRTVSAVAAELGIPGAADAVDLRRFSDLSTIPADTAVFGRVLPEQKRDLVKLLQQRGHTVAMTGDGVNDIPSLKAADIGIAMNTATPATKAVAQLILLDGRFERLPSVVAEGRRVIANMERVSSLFITKTVYAAMLALAVGAAGVAFPFLPRHLSLVAEITIGVPAFALSFRAADEPCRPGYLQRVLRFSVPAGLVAAGATFGAYWAARSPLADANLEQARTAATMTLTLTGLWVLYRLTRPMDRFEGALLATLSVVFALTLIPSPVSRFYALTLPPLRTTLVILAVLVATISALQGLLRVSEHYKRRSNPKRP